MGEEISCPKVLLAGPLAAEKLYLVAAPDAIRLCRDGGYVTVQPSEALWQIVRRQHELAPTLRHFAARLRLAGMSLSTLDDDALIALFRRHLQRRTLVPVKPSAHAGRVEDPSDEPWRIVRTFERLTRGRLRHGGRHYRLVVDVALDRVPSRDSYEVVPIEEARRILHATVEQPDTPPDLAEVLGKAAGMLSTSRRRDESTGLFLLRQIPVAQSVPSEQQPVITPSQMREMLKKTDWIEIEVLEENGEHYTGQYAITLPDGSPLQGNFDSEGLWGRYDIDPGECKLAFPEFSKPAKQPGGGATPAATGELGVHVTEGKANGPDIAGAKVSITGPADKQLSSDAGGVALFSNLPVGDYTVTVEKQGFQTANRAAMVKKDASSSVTVPLVPSQAILAVAGVAEADKTKVGGLLVRAFDGNNAPRKKLTLSMKNAAPSSKLRLECASNKVHFFDAASGGSEIKIDGTANIFAPAGLPRELWIEGVTASDAMRDIEVAAVIEGRDKVKDAAKLTVLWVDTPNVAFSGSISAQNAKRAGYKSWTKSGSDHLGLQEYNNKFGARMGWGSEASAVVHPKKFKFPGSNLKLERDYYFRDYEDKVLLDQGNYTANPPPGNDTGPAQARDDEPSPNDTIYDWDAAGLNIPNAPKGKIMRTRNNFKAFASITVEGRSVRCSKVREYRIRFSQRQTADPSGAKWEIIKPPDVTGDNVASHGTTNVTWDLK